MAEDLPRLGPLERQVMTILWDCPAELCTRDVLERTKQPLAYTTIATVLGNLGHKGLVDRVPMGRTYGFRPLVSRSEYTAALMSEALATGGDRRDALLHFVGTMSADDTAVLRSLLDEGDPAS